MVLPKPTTSQLMDSLPGWPTSIIMSREAAVAWQSHNVPWTWTAPEFKTQTRMLAAKDCPARDMIAWLIHGVRWLDSCKDDVSVGFEGQASFWEKNRSYLQAWVDGSNASVPEEALEVACARLDWHPVWKNFKLATLVDDFYWAREIQQHPSRVAAARKPLSPLGSFELAQASDDYDFQFSCAAVIARGMQHRRGVVAEKKISGTLELLDSPAFAKLAQPFKRCLLVTSALQVSMGALHPFLSERALSVWAHELSDEEQVWWLKKSRSMSVTSDKSAQLLEQGIHPLSFVHRGQEKDLIVLQAINPDAFRYGYILNGLLSNDTPEPLPLPDLDASDMTC